MTRMALSGSLSVDPSVASYRERSTDVEGFGGRRAPIGVRVHGTRLPATTPHIATTKRPVNVRAAVDGMSSGIRTAGRSPA